MNRIIVVIIGRPNVGKSTLFNRLIGKRRALVHDLPGVTRDRIEESAEWIIKRKPYLLTLVDTGGLGGDQFVEEIERQVSIALEGAQVVLLVLDAQAGVLPLDRELVRRLQQSGVMQRSHVFGVVNKVDDDVHEERGVDFYSLGLSELFTLSAEHGRGIDELKYKILQSVGLLKLNDSDSHENIQEHEITDIVIHSNDELNEESSDRPREAPRVAIVGRPNVGKSTFVNALIGEERMITSPMAGTTTDSVDTLVELGGRDFLIIDTAGIRRKSKTEQGVEVLSVIQAKKTLERAQVAILMIDGESGVTDQDEKIGGLIEEVGCSVILVVNKWDLQRKNREFKKDHAAEWVRKEMGFLRFAPLVFVSAKEGWGFEDLADLIDEILHQRKHKVPTHEFTEWVRQEATIHNPRNAKFFLCHQSGKNPPTFVCHVNDPEKIHYSLKRHLLNALRERWGYMGTPVRMNFIEGKNRKSLPKPTVRKPAPAKSNLEQKSLFKRKSPRK